jgi:O-acetyl-ADP-ribose deacetylase (regulator of RNase III)
VEGIADIRYPIEEAAQIILEELGKWKGSQPTMARVVVFDQTAHTAFKNLLRDK